MAATAIELAVMAVIGLWSEFNQCENTNSRLLCRRVALFSQFNFLLNFMKAENEILKTLYEDAFIKQGVITKYFVLFFLDVKLLQ